MADRAVWMGATRLMMTGGTAATVAAREGCTRAQGMWRGKKGHGGTLEEGGVPEDGGQQAEVGRGAAGEVVDAFSGGAGPNLDGDRRSRISTFEDASLRGEQAPVEGTERQLGPTVEIIGRTTLLRQASEEDSPNT